jgi:hypothetical protein
MHEIVMTSFLRLAAVIMAFSFGNAFAQAPNLVSYYFAEREQCTLVLDFQPRRSELVQLSKDARSLALAKDLLKEFKINGSKKCPEAQNVRLLAVFVPGTDNYGRPDFGSRVNLLRLEGSTNQVVQSAEKDFSATEQIGGPLTVTVF